MGRPPNGTIHVVFFQPFEFALVRAQVGGVLALAYPLASPIVRKVIIFRPRSSYSASVTHGHGPVVVLKEATDASGMKLLMNLSLLGPLAVMIVD